MPFFEEMGWWETVKVAQALTIYHVPIAMMQEDGTAKPEDYIMKEGEVEYSMSIVRPRDSDCR